MRSRVNLDILRSFAVCCVITQHLAYMLQAKCNVTPPVFLKAVIDQIGHAGVLVFFVHTSLVLMYSLERIKDEPRKLCLRFYVRRFFRLYPLSICAICLAIGFSIPASPWSSPYAPVKASVLVSNLLLVQNLFARVDIIGPLWSLPYEVQMYLVLPGLYLLTCMKRGIACILALLFLSYVFGVGLFLATGRLNMAAYLPCFLCGVLCYALRKRIRSRITPSLWPPLVGILLLMYCLFCAEAESGALGNHALNELWRCVFGWAVCLALGIAINAFSDNRNKPIAIIAERVATYSYGIYLLHTLILHLVFNVLRIHIAWLGTAAFLVLTLMASFAAYKLVESPLIKLGKRISDPPSSPSESLPR